MPIAAKRPCQGGCGNLVARGYCERCYGARQTPQTVAGLRSRPGSTARLYTAQWQRASKGFLREHPLCVGFGEDPHDGRMVAATDVDHIVPHRGDRVKFWNSSNWQPLCHSCHSRKTATEDGGFGREKAVILYAV